MPLILVEFRRLGNKSEIDFTLGDLLCALRCLDFSFPEWDLAQEQDQGMLLPVQLDLGHREAFR